VHHLQQKGDVAFEGLHKDPQTPLLGYVQEEREWERDGGEGEEGKGGEKKNEKVETKHGSTD
jgi:hypothetical protein